MRRLLRAVVWGLTIPAIWLAASVLLPLVPGSGPDLSGPSAHRIGLLQGPIHTDLLFPLTPDLCARFAFAEAAGVPLQHPDARWLMLGWGSKAFYTTAGTYADITASAVLTAATGDDAVIRLEVTGPLPDAAPSLRYLTLSDAQYQALLRQIEGVFDGQTPLDHPGFTATDAFFPAHGRFHALRTCNVWLGEVLNGAGVPYGLWTPATWSVTLALDWHQPGNGG